MPDKCFNRLNFLPCLCCAFRRAGSVFVCVLRQCYHGRRGTISLLLHCIHLRVAGKWNCRSLLCIPYRTVAPILHIAAIPPRRGNANTHTHEQQTAAAAATAATAATATKRQSDTANKLSTRIWIALRQLFKLYLFLSDYVVLLPPALTVSSAFVFIFIRCHFELNLKFSCYIWMGPRPGGAAASSLLSFWL